MKKILHIITTIDRGGGENHLVDLIKGQIAHGFRVQVAYLKGSGYWESALKKTGVEVIALELSRYGDLKPLLKLWELLKHYHPDIVHAHMPPAELYTRIALKLYRGQPLFVITKHNDEPFYRGRGHKLLGKWVAKRASRIITISDSVNHYICAELGCSSEKVVTINYGIDPMLYEKVDAESINLLRQTWDLNDETYLVGTVARLVPQKALHILLEGFATYLQIATQSAKLVVVGVGPLEADLKKRAAQLKIQEHVLWTGFREDIPIIMNALDVFALTSIYEGFGRVLLEAMAAAKPVVASCVSAIPEVVEDKATGILVPPEQPISLANAFKFFEDDRARTLFGTAGRQRVKEHFTLNNMIERTIEVYRECIKNSLKNREKLWQE